MSSQLSLGAPFLPSGNGDADRCLSQWDTRPETARRLVEWARVESHYHTLEPSAGRGNICAALVQVRARVVAVEIDASRVAHLSKRFERSANPSPIWHADFLSWGSDVRDAFGLVVMNPPYEKNQDLLHVLHALELAPRVVLLARLAFLEGQERYDRLWSQHSLTRLQCFPWRESFVGDTDGTPKSPMAFFEIQRGPGRSCVEWARPITRTKP